MLFKILNARRRRVHRLAKALLKRVRESGLDNKGRELRLRLSQAVARYSDLGFHPDAPPELIEQVRRDRLGLSATMEQIEATISTHVYG